MEIHNSISSSSDSDEALDFWSKYTGKTTDRLFVPDKRSAGLQERQLSKKVKPDSAVVGDKHFSPEVPDEKEKSRVIAAATPQEVKPKSAMVGESELTVNRHIGRQLSSIILGGGIAVFSAPVIFAGLTAVPVVAATALTSVAVGVIGGVSTQGIAEVLNAEPTRTVRYNAHEAQRRFRSAVYNYLYTLEEPAINAIRRNIPYNDERTIEVNQNVSGVLNDGRIAENFKVYIKYAVSVEPVNNGRTFENSVPPPELLDYAENTDETYTLPRNTNYGSRLARSAAYGLVAGTLGAAATPLMAGFTFIPTVVTNTMRVGVLVGIPTVAGAGGSIINMTFNGGPTLDVTKAIELSSEVSKHVNRILACAMANGGKLKIDMVVIIGDATKAKINTSALGKLEIEGTCGIALDMHPKIGQW